MAFFRNLELFTGAVLSGIVLGVLFAPDKGSNTRRKLFEASNELDEELSQNSVERIKKKVDALRKKADMLEKLAERRMSEAAAIANEVKEHS